MPTYKALISLRRYNTVQLTENTPSSGWENMTMKVKEQNFAFPSDATTAKKIKKY
jgi:hypothetical protein